jgi:8-oxo-dGTP pyrophosphatase MutT (NUDIX family)
MRGSSMQSEEPTPRQAGRVLVIDPDGRILLIQDFDPAEPGSLRWGTIGGVLDDGEGSAQAAIRELWEEAGIRATASELAGPVWHRTAEFSFNGVRCRQEEDYYLLHVGNVQVSLDNLDDIERDTVTGHRWWSSEELAATTEAYIPAELPELLRLAATHRGGDGPVETAIQLAADRRSQAVLEGPPDGPRQSDEPLPN